MSWGYIAIFPAAGGFVGQSPPSPHPPFGWHLPFLQKDLVVLARRHALILAITSNNASRSLNRLASRPISAESPACCARSRTIRQSDCWLSHADSSRRGPCPAALARECPFGGPGVREKVPCLLWNPVSIKSSRKGAPAEGGLVVALVACAAEGDMEHEYYGKVVRIVPFRDCKGVFTVGATSRGARLSHLTWRRDV